MPATIPATPSPPVIPPPIAAAFAGTRKEEECKRMNKPINL